MLSQIDLLATSCTDPAAVRRYAKSIAGDMRHLSDLVDSFLRLARPFAQAETSHHVPVFFHDVVVEGVQRSQPPDHSRAKRPCERPAIAGSRLSLLPDGRVAYQQKKRWKDGTTHVVPEPQVLMEQLCALVPRPRASSLGGRPSVQ